MMSPVKLFSYSLALLALVTHINSVQVVSAVAWQDHSFEPPHNTFSTTGKRIINNFKFGGDAVVKENFVRIVPDKQSKRGWIMGGEIIKEDDFTIYARFRISGKGKSLFGDGLGIWVTQKQRPRFEPGFIMGSTNEFTGFGILFDTFRNMEADHVHKDISLVVGNGAPIQLDMERPGCEAKYRYWQEREDFSASESESRAKITLVGNTVSVEIDIVGDNKWTHCLNANLDQVMSLPDGWKENLRFSLSASTGALADNHDIIEFTVTRPHDIHEYLVTAEQKAEEPSTLVDVRPNIRANEVGEHVNDLSYEVKDVNERMKAIGTNVEHKLETYKYEIEAMIKKLQEAEEADAARIEELEKRQKASLEEQLNRRITDLEKRLTGNVESRLNALELKVSRGMISFEGQTGAWKVPLLVVTILILVAFIFATRSIRKLQTRDKMF